MKEEGSMNGMAATMKSWSKGVSSKGLYLLRMMEEVRENNQIKKG